MFWRPGARPLAMMVATLHGESAPRWKSAPFRKLDAVSVGPGGDTVRLNVCEKPLAAAVTVTAPAVAPAVTVTCACPLEPVLTVALESVAGPVTVNVTGTPAA